jgi:uncharacterized damage-inducible protein DinB
MGVSSTVAAVPHTVTEAGVITSMDAFLKYFEAVHRRAVRDVAALPPEADGWAPASGEGENAWGINTLVGHMAGSRLYFVSAYRGEGWVSPRPPNVGTRERWVPALEESFAAFKEQLSGTPDAWLQRKVAMIDSEGGLSGWRLLMMMAEHDIHHRSQIDTYAGLNGWDVPHIYGRSAEHINSLQEMERAKHGHDGPPGRL